MIKLNLSFFSIILLVLVDHAFTQDVTPHVPIYINEFMASNVLAHENANGDYEDWIEIYNSGDVPIDLSGYYMTDSYPADNYWQIPSGQTFPTTVPAKGYLVLYADEKTGVGPNHLGFKLNKNGDQIVLMDKDGVTVLDSISYQDQFRDVSYGRSPDGTSQWVYFTQITPGFKNQQGYTGFVMPPTIDQVAGFYDGGVAVSVQAGRSGDMVRYTLDGSDPTETSLQYTAPVQIDQTVIFKAKAFEEGMLPSQMVSSVFFVDTSHALPVFALMTDPSNLLDPNTGILLHDESGREWERFCQIEYFENQALQFHIPAGLRVQGNTGPRDFDKESFRAYFREGYGEGRLKYRLFPEDSVATFTRLVLRSGYDDSMEPSSNGSPRPTLLRDPLVTELWRKTGGLTPQSRFCVLYLNDSLNGIYDIKQSVDEDFVNDHMGYKDVDVIRTRWDSVEVVYGNREKWNELMDFFENNTLASDDKIAEAARILDLDDFTTLQALIHATQYINWAYGVFPFREKAEEATWQWTIWDADRAYTDVNWNGFTTPFNPLNRDLDRLITKKLLQNQSYKNRFINRMSDLLNTVFSPPHVASIIDSLAQHIAPEIPAEVAKWDNTVTTWNSNVDFLRDFSARRPAIVRQQMQDFFQLDGQVELTLGINGGKGKIQINSVTISRFPWSGKYFKNIPLTVTAIPDPDYRFDGWSDPSLSANETITLYLTADQSLSASFSKPSSINAELIVPKRIPSGQRLPFVVRIRNANGDINPIEQTPLQVTFGAAHADTVIQIKRGAGTGVVPIHSVSDFTLSVQNTKVPLTQKHIKISSVPTLAHSGTLPTGEVMWDNAADHLVTADITIPVDCHLIIRQGTWVVVKKYVNFFVEGRISVEGTEREPVVITSEHGSEPWGGMEFDNAMASFQYCMVLNGGGDLSKGFWHTGHQHIFFGRNYSKFHFDQCFFLYSPGKVFGTADCEVTVTNSVSSFVWHGGEFHHSLLFYQDSHLMNLPNDDHIYVEDIDTDGFHMDHVNPNYPQYSVINRCYFVTGKDDAIDHHNARLHISNCWIEDFIHEGVAASGGDTVRIFNTLSMGNDQGFEAGYTDTEGGPYVFIDHSVAIGNNVGLRIGDSYNWDQWTYKDYMNVTNSVLYNNADNIRNYVYTVEGPLEGALDISYSMTNDPDYNDSPNCITGVPQFDPYYYLLPGSPGTTMGMYGTPMGRTDSTAISIGSVVINEIMYNAPDEMDTKDWIELYNPQPTNQDLSSWVLKDNNNAHTFHIPAGTIIPIGGYWVLCADTAALGQYYPGIKNVSGNIPFGFGDNDQVRLLNSSGVLIDSVAYENKDPWPESADGKGYSLQLLDPRKDNALAENWAQSAQFGGSPGKECVVTPIIGTDPESGKNLPTHFVLNQNYPNPFNPRTRICYAIPRAGRIRLLIFDLLGQKAVELLTNQQQPAGWYSVDLNGEDLPSGMYFYQLQFMDENGSKQRQTKKMILVK